MRDISTTLASFPSILCSSEKSGRALVTALARYEIEATFTTREE